MPVKEAGKGAAEHAASLFDQHYRSLRRLATVILGDPAAAEEVVQDAFVKVCSKWGAFRSAQHLPSYLRQVVVNECRSRLRRQKIEYRVNALVHRRDQIQDSPDLAASMDLWKAVATLPARQRLAVALRYIEDLTEAQIADLMDCPTGTVKSLLSRARTHLAAELGADQNTGGTP